MLSDITSLCANILTAVNFIAAIRAILVPIAVESARNTTMILALKLINSAGDVSAAQLRRLVSAVGAVAVPIADPGFVDTGDSVSAFEFYRYAWRCDFGSGSATLKIGGKRISQIATNML